MQAYPDLQNLQNSLSCVCAGGIRLLIWLVKLLITIDCKILGGEIILLCAPKFN